MSKDKSVCPKCGSAFRHKSTFSRHKANCLKHQSFNCSICLKSFKRKDSLNRHLKNSRFCGQKQAKNKSLSCSICKKGPFRDAYNKARHERQVHGVGSKIHIGLDRHNIHTPTVHDDELSDDT